MGYSNIELNLPDYKGRTPLSIAAKRGYKQIVAILLAQPKINPNYINNAGWLAIHYAVQNGYTPLVKLLLEHPSARSNAKVMDWSALAKVAFRNEHETILKLLLTWTEEIKWGYSCVWWQCCHQCLSLSERFLEYWSTGSFANFVDPEHHIRLNALRDSAKSCQICDILPQGVQLFSDIWEPFIHSATPASDPSQVNIRFRIMERSLRGVAFILDKPIVNIEYFTFSGMWLPYIMGKV